MSPWTVSRLLTGLPRESAAAPLGAAAGTPAPSVYDRAPITASPAELLSLRGKPPAGIDVEALLDETILRYGADGRLETEYRSIYRVLTDKGAKS